MRTLSPLNAFAVVDVETASARSGSICQVGVALYKGETLTDCRTYPVRPEVRFSKRFTAIHGLSAAKLEQAMVWLEVYRSIFDQLDGQVIASHTLYDRRQLHAACSRARCTMFSSRRWIDTCSVARRAWPDLQSYALPFLAQHLGIAYVPHQAADDARAAGAILIEARRAIASRLAEDDA